jgi:excisionase family DNA binding protein
MKYQNVSQSVSSMDEDKLLSVSEAAEVLGMSPRFIRNNLDHIRHGRIGNRLKFYRKDLRDFVESRIGGK